MKRLVAALAGLSIALTAAPALAQSNTASNTADTPIPAKSPTASVEQTKISDLIDNAKTKAVLQADMPEAAVLRRARPDQGHDACATSPPIPRPTSTKPAHGQDPEGLRRDSLGNFPPLPPPR